MASCSFICREVGNGLQVRLDTMSGTTWSHSYLTVSGALERTSLLRYKCREEELGDHGPSSRKFFKHPNYDRLGSVVLTPSLGLTFDTRISPRLFGI